MHSIHPLQQPEILLNIAEYIPKHERPACLRVSKAWYQVLIRLIWENTITLHRKLPVEILQSHAHLVRTLDIGPEHGKNLNSIFPNLQALGLVGGSTKDYEKLISQHTWISRLTIGHTTIKDELWDTLRTGFVHLKELGIWFLIARKTGVDGFWEVCTRLEVLTIFSITVDHPGRFSDMEFPRLKKLGITNVSDRSVLGILDIMVKCPNLTSIQWVNGPTSKQIRNDFYDLLNARTWPHLNSLELLPWCMVNDASIHKLFAGVQQATRLRFKIPPSLGSTSLDLLQPHYSSLREIDFRLQFRDLSMCPLAQEILSSCPVLEVFHFTQINGTTIMKGRPWVCLGLQELNLDILFDRATLYDAQPHVLDQLSKLTRLRELSVWTDMLHMRGDLIGQVPLDLRIEKSLGKLSTLRSLEFISWGISRQWMEEQECQWILDHWKCLERVVGRFNVMDCVLNELLEDRLREQDIYTRNPTKR
ncbi:hypothetical protein BGX31_010400 [Mortierella sp. GBA43]|nr:hypothetical protein BGX31_010400 [Mortierella sp. GBA43]